MNWGTKVRECLTASDIANQVSMMRSVFKGTVILVEGVTDSRLYGKFADHELTEVVITHSKDNVRNAIRISSVDRKDRRIIGIIDTDRLNGITRSEPVFSTDCRDAEMMIIRSEAFDSVVYEYSDSVKLESFEERIGNIKDSVLSAAYPAGLLMYISGRDGLGLLFKDLDPETFVNPRTLSANVGDLVNEVLGRSRTERISRSELSRRLQKELSREYDPYDVCRGHDAVSVLLFALQRNFGGFNCHALRDGEVGGALRLAFSREMFEATELYRRTSEWSASSGSPLWSVKD
jgi:hypothetical protein